jgi:hypothetical protein
MAAVQKCAMMEKTNARKARSGCGKDVAGLVARGFAVVRFHFPHMQRPTRESRHTAPDRTPVLLGTWDALLTDVRV